MKTKHLLLLAGLSVLFHLLWFFRGDLAPYPFHNAWFEPWRIDLQWSTENPKHGPGFSDVLTPEEADLVVRFDYVYADRIQQFREAADKTQNPEEKGEYLLSIARIYDDHFKDYPASSDYALQAAATRPGWGEPYLHLGRLYINSSRLCGPGDIWEGQTMIWPAIDNWEYAKKVDPTVTSEADRLIDEYWNYLPTKEDLFMRGLRTGDTFYVSNDWFGVNTRVRGK